MDVHNLIIFILFNIFSYVLFTQGKHLKVSTILQHPYLFKKDGGGQNYDGYIKELMEKLKKDMGFTYEFVPTPDGQFGRQKNGTWTGTIQQVVSGQADMIAGPLTVTEHRTEVIDFSYPFQISDLVLVLRRPDQERLPVADRLKRIWSPFESSVWLLAVAAYFITSSAIYIISYFNPYEWRRMARDGEATIREGESFTCMNSFWFSLSALTLQGYVRAPRSLGARIVVTAWWMFVIVLVSCYISKLTGLLQIRPDEKEIEGYMKFQSLEDIVEHKTKFIVLKNGAVHEFLKTNTEQDAVATLRNELEPGGDGEYADSVKEGIEMLMNYPSGKKTFITESLMVTYQAQKYSCQFYFANAHTLKRQYSFGFPKNSTLTDEIGKLLLRYNEQGFLTFLRRRWFTGSCKQYVFDGTDEDYEVKKFYALDTASFSGALIVLIVGLLAGVLVTLGEYFVFKWAESNDHPQNGIEKTEGRQKASLLEGQTDKNDTQV